jgi:hypothetical protein
MQTPRTFTRRSKLNQISSDIMTIPPGTTTEWMVHPVQGFVFVLERTLTVAYADGPKKVFKAG